MSDDRGRPIGTFTGQRMHPLDPHPDEIRIEDIAHGLANTCRYGGQCQFYYSVGTHSIYVSKELSEYGPEMQLYGLFHDAAEAYITDLPRPVKAEIEGYDGIESGILSAVWDTLSLSHPTEQQWKTVMAVDDQLFHYESEELLAEFDPPSVPELSYKLTPCAPADVREQFLSRTEQLQKRVV